MSTEDRRAHDYVHMSLREQLVPMSVWMRQVIKRESIAPVLEINFTESFKQEATGLYAAPYSPIHPYWRTYMHDKYGLTDADCWKKITQRDADAISEKLSTERILPRAKTAISDEEIALIDSNYDIGCIYYGGYGVVVPFEYPKVKQIIHTSTPAMLAARLKYQSCKSEEEAKQLLEEMDKLKGHAVLTFMFDYVDDEGDLFYKPGKVFEAFLDLIPSIETVDATIEYMQTMFECHAKCMIL